jgi:hypothetical protein
MTRRHHVNPARVVGAPGEAYHGKSGGQVYVYTTSGKWVQTLTSPNEQDMGDFGYSVAVDRKIILGAFGESLNAGHAYVFS